MVEKKNISNNNNIDIDHDIKLSEKDCKNEPQSEFIKFTNIKHLNSSILRNTAEFGAINAGSSFTKNESSLSSAQNELTSEKLKEVFEDYKNAYLDKSKSSVNKSEDGVNQASSEIINENNSNFYEKYIQSMKHKASNENYKNSILEVDTYKIPQYTNEKDDNKTSNFGEKFDKWSQEDELKKVMLSTIVLKQFFGRHPQFKSSLIEYLSKN